MTSSSQRRLTFFKSLAACAWLYGLTWLVLGWHQLSERPLNGWALADAGDLIGERVSGAEIVSLKPLELRAKGPFSFGLNFRGAPLSTAQLSPLRMDVRASAPTSVYLLAQCHANGPHFLSAPIAIDKQPIVIDWQADLGFAATNGSGLSPECLRERLASLSLHGDSRGTLFFGPLQWLAGATPAAPVQLSAWTPERWLAKRDQSLERDPGLPVATRLTALPLALLASVLAGMLLLALTQKGTWLSAGSTTPVIWARGSAAHWREAASFTLAGLGAIALIGWAQQSSLSIKSIDLLRYLAFVPVQQLILFGLLNGLAQRLFKADLSPLAIGILFALLHTPNFALMLLTLLAGMAWAKQLKSHRTLLPIIASHLILGIALGALSQGDLVRNLRAGFGFFG